MPVARFSEKVDDVHSAKLLHLGNEFDISDPTGNAVVSGYIDNAGFFNIDIDANLSRQEVTLLVKALTMMLEV